MPLTWRPEGPNAPETIDQLRLELTKLVKKRSNRDLVFPRFRDLHLFPGHKGSIEDLAAALARYRGIVKSSLVLDSMDTRAKDEVLNWVETVPAGVLQFNAGLWTLDIRNAISNLVPAVYPYDFAGVDADELKKIKDPKDVVTKSRKWLTISKMKQPKIGCQFDADGTPMIYHLDF